MFNLTASCRGLETPSKWRIFRSKGNFLECAYNVTRANATVSLDPPDANKAGAHGFCPLVLPWAADTGRRRSCLAKLPGQVTSAHQCFRSHFHSALLPGVTRRRNWAAQRTSTPTRPPAPSSAPPGWRSKAWAQTHTPQQVPRCP